jgi:outer membrane protein OmpA-like peptidoglycan-associated protein
VSRGIPAERFEETIYGKVNPLASNKTVKGMQLNRSVRIHLGFRLAAEESNGRVLSDTTDQPVRGKVFIQSGYHFDTVTLDENGAFTALVPRDKIVSLEVFGEGHYLPKEYINLTERSGDLGVIKALPYREGVLFDFPEILFVGNEDMVLPEYRNQLPRIYLMMKGAPGYKFEIQGHVNYPNAPPQPTNTFHFDLSERRAKAIFNYLVDKGIDPDLLEWKGYSNWKMIYPNARTEEQQRQNRRISIKVLGRTENQK